MFNGCSPELLEQLNQNNLERNRIRQDTYQIQQDTYKIKRDLQKQKAFRNSLQQVI